MTLGITAAAAPRRLDRLIWTMVAVVAAVVLAAPFASTFSLDWPSFAGPALASLALVALAWFYRERRNDLRLASGLECTAQVVVFAAVGAPLSYLAASANLPLHDQAFDAIDQALGLDWRSLFAWMNAHPSLHSLFALSYMSFTVQATTTVLALAFSNRLLHLRTFMLAFIFSAVVCIAISGAVPSEGIWGYYRLSAADHPAIVPAVHGQYLPFFYGLRDGSLRALTGLTSEGIITFPSFHAALGVVFMVALWPVPVLRWIGAAVNGLMVLATPADGGHYFIDVIAGVVIAVACLYAAQAIVRRARSPSMHAAETVAEVVGPPIVPIDGDALATPARADRVTAE
jgi:hypothetical protein